MALTIGGGLISEATIDGTRAKEVTIDGDFAFGQIGETGTTSLSTTIDGGEVDTISFSKSYDNPVVFVYISTRGGGQSLDARARNVTSTDCEIFMEEPDEQGHNTETVPYLVMEEGVWTFPNGTAIEVGSISTSSVSSTGVNGDTVTYSASFSSTPAIIHSLNTYNNSDFMSTGCTNVDSADFTLYQEAAETGTSSATETVAWMAIPPSSGTNNGYAYEANFGNGGSNDGVGNTPHTISFTQSFGSTPDIITKMNTRNGGDGGWARSSGTQWNTNGHETYAEEDQVNDTERGHVDETFGWFAIESNAVIYGHS